MFLDPLVYLLPNQCGSMPGNEQIGMTEFDVPVDIGLQVYLVNCDIFA